MVFNKLVVIKHDIGSYGSFGSKLVTIKHNIGSYGCFGSKLVIIKHDDSGGYKTDYRVMKVKLETEITLIF